MKSGETKRYPFQDQDKRTKLPVKTEKYIPEVLIEVFQDIERLTKGREQLSKKELIKLKKKYLNKGEQNGNERTRKVERQIQHSSVR